MWPAKFLMRSGREPLFVFIGARHIEWHTGDGTQASLAPLQRRMFDPGIDGNGEVALQALLLVLQQVAVPQGMQVIEDMRVMVADSWLASVNVPWSPAMIHSESALHFARERLIASGYAIQDADRLCLDRARYGAPRLAFSYPEKLLDALHQCATRLQLRLRSVLPLSAVSWLAVQRRYGRHGLHNQALLVADDCSLMVLQSGDAGARRMQEVTVRSRPTRGPLRDDELHKAWQRLCLRQPHLRNTCKVALLDMTVRTDAATAIDPPFVRLDLGAEFDAQRSPALLARVAQTMHHHSLDGVSDSASKTSWRWVVLFAAALLTSVLAIQALRTRATVVALTSKLENLRSASEMRRQSGAAKSSWRREELPRITAVNAAIRQLNLPIALILRSLVPPPDVRVAVLSVETVGNVAVSEMHILKIVAEAATSADMARYVAFLDERRPFVRAYLMKHEIDMVSSERPYRFSMEVPWSE